MGSMSETLHVKASAGPCEPCAWPTEGIARRVVEAARERHGKGGLDICVACLERAKGDALVVMRHGPVVSLDYVHDIICARLPIGAWPIVGTVDAGHVRASVSGATAAHIYRALLDAINVLPGWLHVDAYVTGTVAAWPQDGTR